MARSALEKLHSATGCGWTQVQSNFKLKRWQQKKLQNFQNRKPGALPEVRKAARVTVAIVVVPMDDSRVEN